MNKKNNAPPAEDPWDNPLQVLHKTEPTFSDAIYPHLVDLNEFIKSQASSDKLTVLDYGAGGSPYRKYFPNADYRRADITEAASLQYHIKPDSTIAEADETFDLILSTQVAEHVINPDVYFKEAFRLLKKGGKFILTTHGIWDEHGSPYDFQRWTGSGLSRDLEAAGFKQPGIYKLTCGMRAALLIFTRALFAATPPPRRWRKFLFKAFRLPYSKIFPFLYKLGDRWWPEDKIVKVQAGKPAPTWYLVIAAVAQK
jgi:SAM-dependent methyltransferase